MTDARVLIVEDEVIVAEGLRRTLQASGYAVVGHATKATEAVQLVEHWHPDVVLMDVNLDGAREGIDAARAIHRLSDAAVVFVSAYADEGVLNDAVDSGALGYVVKPFQPRQVASAIEVALYQRRTNPAQPGPRPADSPPRDPTGVDYGPMLARLETFLHQGQMGPRDSGGSTPVHASLTPREWDVVRGLVCYRRLPQVAGQLGISTYTARNHLKSIFRKLNLHSQDELFSFLLGG